VGGMTPQQWAAEWPRHSGLQPWVNPLNNRLTHVGDNQTAPPQTHVYDVCGNVTSETTSRRFEWDHSDRLRAFVVQPSGGAASIQAQYLYDAAGQRVKKVVLKQDGTVQSTVYVSSIFEHHTWSSGQNIRLHVMDNQQRIAMVRVGSAHPSDQAPEVQFHLGDHLGNSSLVIDNAGAFVNREEYTPYGETVFGSFAQKRYRFTGKERDEESGLYYQGARYFAPWIVRWTSCDPAGAVDSYNLYVYCKCNPLMNTDPTGKGAEQSNNDGSQHYPPWLKAQIAAGVADDRFSKPGKLDVPERDFKKASYYDYNPAEGRVKQQKSLKQLAMDDLACKPLVQASEREQVRLNTPWYEQVIFDFSEHTGGNDMARGWTGASEYNEEYSGLERVGVGLKGVGTAASWALPVAQSAKGLQTVRVGLLSRTPVQLKGVPTGPAFRTIEEASGMGNHYLQVQVRNKNGKVIAEWFEASEGGGLGLSGHTEAKALNRMNLKPGQEVLFIGEYQPCNRTGGCNMIMSKAAKETGADIVYFAPDSRNPVRYYQGGVGQIKAKP